MADIRHNCIISLTMVVNIMGVNMCVNIVENIIDVNMAVNIAVNMLMGKHGCTYVCKHVNMVVRTGLNIICDNASILCLRKV